VKSREQKTCTGTSHTSKINSGTRVLRTKCFPQSGISRARGVETWVGHKLERARLASRPGGLSGSESRCDCGSFRLEPLGKLRIALQEARLLGGIEAFRPPKEGFGLNPSCTDSRFARHTSRYTRANAAQATRL
jgi:hypothetical protein